MRTARYSEEWFSDLISSMGQEGCQNIGIAGGKSPDFFIEYFKKDSCFKLHTQFIVIDDRDVDNKSSQSNYSQLRRKLGSNFMIMPTQYFWDNKVESCEIDLLILGMGEDGHIASIFPGMIDEDVVPGGCAYKTLRPFGDPFVSRFSLNERTLHSAKKIILALSSSEKSRLLQYFISIDDDIYPVVRLIKGRPDLVICRV